MDKPVFTAQFPLLKSFLIALFFVCSNTVWGQTDLVRWNLTADGNVSYSDPTVIADAFSSEQNSISYSSSGASVINWNNSGYVHYRYMSISVSSSNGDDVDIGNLMFEQETTNPPTNYTIRYYISADGNVPGSSNFFNNSTVLIDNESISANPIKNIPLNMTISGSQKLIIRFYTYGTHWTNDIWTIKANTLKITSPTPPMQSDLEIQKTVSNNEPEVDDNVTFTIDVTNNGPDDATGVTVTDVLPTGYDFVSSTQGTYNAGTRTITWNIGNLAASASTSFDIVAKVLASGTYNNTASVTANEPDPDTDNNNDTVTVTPDIPTANLGITKTVDDNSPSVSQNVTFTLTVTNNGPDDATGVTVTDELPSGYTYVSHSTEDGSFDEGTGEWTIGNLSNGNSATLTITATVLSSGNHTNTATVTANEFDPTTGNNTDSETVTIDYGTTDLEIETFVSHDQDHGGFSFFIISVRNNGPDSATNVLVEDDLDEAWNFSAQEYEVSQGIVTATGAESRNIEWAIPHLPSGGVAVLVFRAINNSNWSPWGEGKNNTATITAMHQSDSDTSNNSYTSMSVVYWNNHIDELSVTKSVSPEEPYIGEEVEFTIVVEKPNNQDGASGSLELIDKLPPGYTYISHTVSQGTYTPSTGVWVVQDTWSWTGTETLTITARVNAPTGVPDEYKSIATIFSQGAFPDTEISNNMASATIPTPVADPASTDLSITKTVNNASPTVLSNVVFTLTAKNDGPNDTTGVVVNDPLPAGFAHVSNNGAGAYNPNTGEWNVGALANGASKTLIITAKVIDTENRAVEDYTNTATISGDRSDSNPGNNEDDAVVTPFFPEADLAVTNITIDNDNPSVGNNVAFTINVLNNGPSSALGVAVDALLPSGYQFVSSTPPAGTSYNSSTGIWTIGSLAVGVPKSMTITAKVLATGIYAFNAEISGAVEDPDTDNNTNNEDISLDNIVDLAITKEVTSSPTPDIGDQVTFEITVENVGTNDATGVVVTDVIPSGYDYVSNNGGATYDAGTRTLTWNVGNLNASDDDSFTITTTARAGGIHKNIATVAADQGDTNATNNSDFASVTPNVGSAVDLKVVQSVTNETPNIGNTVTFTITASNNGPLSASGVFVKTLLANGLQITGTPVASVGSYIPPAEPGGWGTWNIGNMTTADTPTLTVQATVLGDVGAAYLSIAEITGNEAASDNIVTNNSGYSILSPIGQQFSPCDVNAEEPAFFDDFGSGASPYAPELEQGRTNMEYASGVDIQDGQYTVAKNAQLGYFNWQDITDPSGDPDGYFMIVNADIDPYEFFRTRITLSEEFCTNTRYNINLKVTNVNSQENYDYCSQPPAEYPAGYIEPEIGYFVINDKGEVLGAGTSETIPFNAVAEWLDKEFVFVSGQDDEWVELVLFNKAPGGCGNDLAIDDISVYACMTPPIRLDMIIDTTEEEVCGGETVTMTVINTPDPENPEDNYTWPPEAWGGEFGIVEYQWQRSDDGINFTDIVGETTDTYVIEDFHEEDQAYYRLMYAQNGNIDKVFCRFPSAQYYPVFNATPVIPPIEIVGDVNYICGDGVPDGTLQLYTDYDTSAYIECDENGENCESTWGEDFYLWESSDSGVATINQDGLVTAVSTGTTTITYTVWSPKGSCWDSVTKDISVLADCPTCVEEPTDIITGGDPSKIGISTLDDQLPAWPENIPNGFIVLESKDKGFVITRVSNTSTVTIAEPVEGMLVYDETDKCIKLYNGSEWNCIEQECDEVP